MFNHLNMIFIGCFCIHIAPNCFLLVWGSLACLLDVYGRPFSFPSCSHPFSFCFTFMPKPCEIQFPSHNLTFPFCSILPYNSLSHPQISLPNNNLVLQVSSLILDLDAQPMLPCFTGMLKILPKSTLTFVVVRVFYTPPWP